MRLPVPILFSTLLALAACVETRLIGSVPLDGAAREPSRSVAVPAQPQERLRGDLVASGRSGTFFRNATNGSHITWRAPDGSALVTWNGLLTATFGLGYDLLTAEVSDAYELIRAGRSGTATRVHRYLDGENQVFTRAFRCDIAFVREVDRFQRVREVCRGADVTFENDYVLAANGRIVTSQQWVGEEIGSIRLTRLASEQTGPTIVVVDR